MGIIRCAAGRKKLFRFFLRYCYESGKAERYKLFLKKHDKKSATICGICGKMFPIKTCEGLKS